MGLKREEFYFDSRDGVSKIHAVRYTPEASALADGRPRAVLQIVHGMSEYVERYSGLAEFFTGRGFVVTGDDHLGHGRTVGEGGTYGYFCPRDPATVVVRDVHRLKKMTQALYPGVPYVILGHSMGSFILRNYICRYGTGIQGAVIVGTGMQPPAMVRSAKALTAAVKLLRGGRHVSRLVDRAAFGSYNRRIANPRTPFDWLSRDGGNVDRYLEDPMCGFIFTVNGFQTLFELISRVQKKENLEKIPKDLPLFMVSGADDPVGEYGEGVRRAYRSLKDVGIQNIRLKLYEGDRHEVLNEADREVVMRDILAWLEQNVPADVL